MITGVKALIFAAATAALPFTPPPGWVQLPQSAVSARASTWQGPKAAHGAPPTFSAVVFPFPGGADMLAKVGQKMPKSMKLAPGALTQISNVAVNLCGTPARFITNRVQTGGVNNVIQQEIAVKNGYAYMLMYTRVSGTASDPRVVHAMRAFCPSGVLVNPQVAMPAAWSKSNGDMQMTGVWMGTRPGEMMMLMRASQMKSLDQLSTSAQHYSLKDKSTKNFVKVTQQKTMSMCGYPGKMVDMTVSAGPMPFSIHTALTQGNGVAYVLMYTEIGSSAADPAALGALQTLCVTGASPLPSASPSAAPSAAAAPSTTPSASPVPTPTP